MESLNSRSIRSGDRPAGKTSLVNVRLAEQLVASLKKLAEQRDETMTDFIRVAIENEVSRRLLCRPEKQLTLLDLDRKMSALLALVGPLAGEVELHSATLSAMYAAMGLDRE